MEIINFLAGIELSIGSFLPGFLYLIIIFISTPYSSWNFGRAMAYFVAGCLSAPIILIFFKLFPAWSTLYSFPDTIVLQLLIMAFIQVAFLEETTKYLLYQVFRKKVLKIKIQQHPMAIMIYAGAVSLGFAFVENMIYGLQHGVYVIYWRAATSVIIHMSCGMMMGYWISLSRHKFNIKTNPTEYVGGTSIFDVLMRTKPKLRSVFYTAMGLLMAIFFHGLYDFNLMGVTEFSNFIADYNMLWTIQLIILFFALYLTREMANHLIKLDIKNKSHEN